MSIYSCGSFGKISVGSEIVYIYGLNLFYDRCSFDCGTDEFDLSDIEFSSDEEQYRCGRGTVASIDVGKFNTTYYLLDGTEIEDGLHMVIEVGSGTKDFIDYIDSAIYPINQLTRSVVGMRVFRQNMLAFIGISNGQLTVKECAALYGEHVICKLLDHNGCDWRDNIEMVIDANFLKEMEHNCIKDVMLCKVM